MRFGGGADRAGERRPGNGIGSYTADDAYPGVVFGQQYLMLDYDCPRAVLDEALKVTPGLESPTLAPLADEAWVAVRALAPRKGVNTTMDALAAIGAKAILASEVRFFRA